MSLADETMYAAEISALASIFDTYPDFGAADARHFVANAPQDAEMFWSAPDGFYQASSDLQTTFSDIYARGVWRGGSGAGSDVANALLYAAYLQHLIRQRGTGRIVDLGCGDWRFTKHIDLGDCDYIGVDIVSDVVARNTATHGTARIQFVCADVTTFQSPSCDLLLCKDVLQHLSHANVAAVLARLTTAKTALLTNDFHPVNRDCNDGDTRPLDPTVTPFSFNGRPRLAFSGKVAFLAQR